MASITETVVCALLLCIIILVIVPINSYYLVIFWRNRSNPIISKRHYKIMVMLNLLLMVSLIGDKSLYMVSILVTPDLDAAHSHIVYRISDYFYFFVGPTVLLTMASLTWMLFYDIRWLSITNPGNKWTHFINPSFNPCHDSLFANNWFIKNQGTFGNTRWVTKHVVVPFCAMIYLSIFCTLYIHSHFHYFVFLVLFILFVYRGIPKQHIEVFKIRKQIDLMMATAVSFVLFFGAYVVLKLLVTDPRFAMYTQFETAYLYTF